jgi:hypothetical protein
MFDGECATVSSRSITFFANSEYASTVTPLTAVPIKSRIAVAATSSTTAALCPTSGTTAHATQWTLARGRI